MIKKVLVIAEHDNKKLQVATLHAITAAEAIPCDKHISILVAGLDCEDVARQASAFKVQKVLWADNVCYQHALAENMAALIGGLGKEFDYIIAAANSFGKNILPRVAALVDVAQVSEVVQIVSEDTFQRPIYAGNALETIQSLDPIKVFTIRTTAFEAANKVAEKAAIEVIDAVHDLKLSSFVKEETPQFERPELTTASIVIAGGRGLQSRENFKLIEALADKLQAAIGASRAAVDAGFISNDHQVGQTGKVVAPTLYIAVGISGAIQHLAGMKDSKVIVAINQDADAPIFQVADYGLVGDLFVILPELTALL